jgi:hypothetical protein
MKTSFRAKVIVEFDYYSKDYSLKNLYDRINNGKLKVEIVDDFLTNDIQPVLIIKIK